MTSAHRMLLVQMFDSIEAPSPEPFVALGLLPILMHSANGRTWPWNPLNIFSLYVGMCMYIDR